MRQLGTFRAVRVGRQAGFCAALLALAGLLALPVMAQQAGAPDSGNQSSSSAQSTQQKQPPAHKSSDRKDSGAQKNSAAQENPFPEDVSKQAAQPPGNQPGDAPAAPDADQQNAQKPGDAAKDNPFPEDVSKGAAAAAASKDNDGGASSGSSSSSSSSSNASGDADANVDPNADVPRDTGRRKLKKPSDKDIQSGSLAGQGEAQDDIRVGRFYLGTGDYKGAYARFSEATRMDPVNVDAIYGLAAAAAGLHHTDEALTNYKLYLQIAPDGNNAKSARKAIHSLSK
jgi:tetratricopeptide (TPR) repeat protein